MTIIGRFMTTEDIPHRAVLRMKSAAIVADLSIGFGYMGKKRLKLCHKLDIINVVLYI